MATALAMTTNDDLTTAIEGRRRANPRLKKDHSHRARLGIFPSSWQPVPVSAAHRVAALQSHVPSDLVVAPDILKRATLAIARALQSSVEAIRMNKVSHTVSISSLERLLSRRGLTAKENHTFLFRKLFERFSMAAGEKFPSKSNSSRKLWRN